MSSDGMSRRIRLPLELGIEIMKGLHSPSGADLKNASLICSALRIPAQTRLFNHHTGLIIPHKLKRASLRKKKAFVSSQDEKFDSILFDNGLADLVLTSTLVGMGRDVHLEQEGWVTGLIWRYFTNLQKFSNLKHLVIQDFSLREQQDDDAIRLLSLESLELIDCISLPGTTPAAPILEAYRIRIPVQRFSTRCSVPAVDPFTEDRVCRWIPAQEGLAELHLNGPNWPISTMKVYADIFRWALNQSPRQLRVFPVLTSLTFDLTTHTPKSTPMRLLDQLFSLMHVFLMQFPVLEILTFRSNHALDGYIHTSYNVDFFFHCNQNALTELGVDRTHFMRKLKSVHGNISFVSRLLSCDVPSGLDTIRLELYGTYGEDVRFPQFIQRCTSIDSLRHLILDTHPALRIEMLSKWLQPLDALEELTLNFQPAHQWQVCTAHAIMQVLHNAHRDTDITSTNIGVDERAWRARLASALAESTSTKPKNIPPPELSLARDIIVNATQPLLRFNVKNLNISIKSPSQETSLANEDRTIMMAILKRVIQIDLGEDVNVFLHTSSS